MSYHNTMFYYTGTGCVSGLTLSFSSTANDLHQRQYVVAVYHQITDGQNYDCIYFGSIQPATGQYAPWQLTELSGSGPNGCAICTQLSQGDSSSSSGTGSLTSGGEEASSGYDKLYFPTNSDTRRRMGRMEQAYSLNDPYGTLSIRPVISNGAVSGFDPISVVYCPSTEKVYCGDNDHFIYALNPKKTGLKTIPLGHRTLNQWGVLGNLGSYGDDHSSVSVTAEYDSEFIKEDDSANGAMHKTRTITTSNFSGKAEVRFLIRMGQAGDGWAGASYYYGYKITKNNTSGTLSLGNVIAEGCYNENVNKSYSKSTAEGESAVNLTSPSTLGDLGDKWTPYLITVEIDEGDSLELWVGGAMEDCASTGGSTSSVSQKISIKDYKAQALYGDSLEECVIWNGPNDFERKDYIGNFTSYENRHYVDGVYSPINDSIYYAFGSKDLYETLNGGYGIVKLNPYTNVIEEEIGLYNFDPSTNQIYADSNLSQMKNVLPLPKKLIYCPTNNRIYILHGDPIKSWVTVLNPSSDKISGSFTHASFLDSSDIEYSAVNDKIYVTNKAGYAISVINPHINATISLVLPFLCDSRATLLLHLDFNFCDACSGSGGDLAVSLRGTGAIIKDSEMSILFAKDIDYKTSFSFDPDEEKLDKEKLLPDNDYSRRWKEKDFNKTQCNRTHAAFDGETCQKIPYRPEWGAANDEFTIEFWVKPDENYFITPGNVNDDLNSNEWGRYYWERYDPKVNPEKIDKVSKVTVSGEPLASAMDGETNYAGSSMLLFSFGNPHQPVDTSYPIPDDLPTWLGGANSGSRHLGCAFGLVLRQGKTHDDPDRGKLRLWSGIDGGDSHGNQHNFLDIDPIDDTHRIKFGEWNHIAMVKKPLHHMSGEDVIKEAKLITYVNGVKWKEIEVDFDLNPAQAPLTGDIDGKPIDDFDKWTELAEKARTLYLGGAAGNKLLWKISGIDFETDEITTNEPHGLGTGDEINIYSSSGTYPLGVSEFTKYYIKKVSDDKLTLYLTKGEAMDPAEIAPVNLKNLSLLIADEEFKYSARGVNCLTELASNPWGLPFSPTATTKCESSAGHQERIIMDTQGWPTLIETPEEIFSHKATRKGTVSIDMKFKTCAVDYYRFSEELASSHTEEHAEFYRLAQKTISIYKNNKFYQLITLDSRFAPEKNLPSCAIIDAFDSPLIIECKEEDVISAVFGRHLLSWNIFETTVTESSATFNDLSVSQLRVITHDWMHYSGLMNCFRFSNIVRYDRNFRPLRFNDFKEDEHTLLLVNGDGKAEAKNDFLDLTGGNYTAGVGLGHHTAYGSGAGILETSSPSPGVLFGFRGGVNNYGVVQQGMTPSWVEEPRRVYVEEAGASYTLPLGYEASSIMSIKDVDGKFDFHEGQDFQITVEARSLETPYYGGEDFEGDSKPMILAHYVSEDEAIEYEFVASKTNHPDLAPNGSGLYFRQWNEGALVVNMFAGRHPSQFDNWDTYYVSRTIAFGENNLSTFSIGLAGSSPISWLGIASYIGYTELTVNRDVMVKSHYPESFSKKGTFTIGGFNTSTRRPNNPKKRMAIGQYRVLGAGTKEILELDPHIGNYRNKLGSAYSDLDGLCFYEMKNVEIISLGKLAAMRRGNENTTLGNRGTLSSACDLTGSAPLVDPSVGFNILNPVTKLVDKSLSVGKAGWKINSLSNVDQQGVAFFKGNTQITQDDAHLWRQASDESYIKHLPHLGETSGSFPAYDPGVSTTNPNIEVRAPIYGFDPDLSSFGNKNFIIECSIMPMKLPVDDDDTDAAVDAEMGILCFNYDDLDNSDVDWADCPDYTIDELGNTLSQCSNDVNGNIYWQSTGSNTGTVGWELKTNTSGTVEFNFGSQERNTIPGDLDYYYDGTSRNLTSTTALSYNNWYTITISRIGDNVHLYINGSLESSIDIGKETILEHPINLGVSKYEKMGLLIGKSYNGVTDDSSTPYYFTGLMEEVRIRPSKGNAHHTFRPNKSFELDRARKSFVDSSLVSHDEATTDQHAQLWIGSADYLHLNFNNFINNKAPRGVPEFGTTYSEDGNWLIGPGPRTKPNGITFDIEQEGIIKLRNNDEEGVLRLGQDGYLEIMGSSKLDLGENFVIEGWSLSSENQTLISRTDSSGSGWSLELQQSGLSFVLWESSVRIKEIKGYYSSGPIRKWDHFAVQLENASIISLMLDGNCIASDELSAAQYAVMNTSSDQAMYIGSNSRSEILYLDNIRVIKEAIYKNYKKPTYPQGKIELIREPDTYHLNSKGVNYEKSHLSDHSLKFKSNYAKGDYGKLSFGNANAEDLADFNFGSEDFTVEFFFRADDLGDLKAETTALITKGLPGGLDSDFSIGLENRTITGGIRRSRLVAEACGVRLVAKENRAPESNVAPDTLWFYNVDDFHNNDFAGDNNDPDDYIIQKYKHVMLCRHTYAGVPYLSLFVDKRLVASSYEISSYDSVTDTFTYSSVQVGDSEDDTTYGVEIGGHEHSPGTYGYFSGNISLLKIERGTNPNLSVSYADEWLKDRLKAGAAARVYSIPGDSTSTILTNQYGGSSGKWATGMKLHDQNILFQQDFEGYSSHENENTLALGSFSSPEGAVLAYEDSGIISYPDVDGWYLQPNILRDSRVTTLPVPGGTELFLDFKESVSLDDGVLCRDLGPKAKEYSLLQRGENIIDSLDKNTKGMYTPPTNVSSAYFGKISATTINSKHTTDVNDYIVAYDNKNKWNYFDEDFTVATWIKPENLANNPILFSRNASGLLMDLAVDNSGKLIFTSESQRSSLIVESEAAAVKENEWTHVVLSRGTPPGSLSKKWFWYINGQRQEGVLTRGQVNDIIPKFTGSFSDRLSIGRRSMSIDAYGWSVDEATELYIHQGDAAEDDSDFYDFSSDNHTITANGSGSGSGPIWAKPASGPMPGTGTEDLSIEFDGVDDDLEVSGNWIRNIASNNAERETTWECWFNTSSTDLQYLVCLNTSQHYWGLSIEPSGANGWTIQWSGNISPAGDSAVSANVAIDTATWHHVVVVKDGERLEIYFDGARVAYTDLYVEPIDYGWDNITIGSQHYSGGAHRYFFTGSMDEIRFSNTKRYNVGLGPGASSRQFEGYMSEFLIATTLYEGVWGQREIYVHSGLDSTAGGTGGSTSALHAHNQGAQTIYPSDIKFLLNFDDLEDHSMDVERDKPETSEETVLLLPFDRDIEDKSGQKKEAITSGAICLRHLKYSTGGESPWWVNKASKGRQLVGDYKVHGSADIEPDNSNNNAVNFPGDAASYLSLHNREGSPQIIETDKTKFLGECCDSKLEEYMGSDWAWVHDCPNRYDYSLEFWVRPEDPTLQHYGAIAAASGQNVKQLMIPLVGGEHIDSQGDTSTYFYVCLKIDYEDVGDPGGGVQGGSIVVCARDEWDANPQNDNAKKFADGKIRTDALADNIILSEEHQGLNSSIFGEIAEAHAADLKHVYVARKDGFWFLYVNGQYVDHMKEGEGRNNLYTKDSAGDISLNQWRVGGRTNISVKDKPYVSVKDEAGRWQGEPWVTEGVFKGKIDMVREISGGIPYNPMEWKGAQELPSSNGAVKSFVFTGAVQHFAEPQLNDINVFYAFEKGQKGFPHTMDGLDGSHWDRKLNEFYCTTGGNCENPPPPPPPPPPPCFLAGTKISMEDGSEKNIEDIIIGDKVKSLNVDTNEEASSLVVGVTKHDHTEGYYIINDDLKVTGEHPMRANDEWKNINELFVGDQLLHLDGSRVVVESIEKINDTVTTYNINVEDIDNYFANLYLSHNKDPVSTGACCDTLGQICHDNISEAICHEGGYHYYGDGTSCISEGSSCGGGGGGPSGACCYAYTNGYLCVEITEVNCHILGLANEGSQWYGVGSICRTSNPGTVNYGDCGGSIEKRSDEGWCNCEDALAGLWAGPEGSSAQGSIDCLERMPDCAGSNERWCELRHGAHALCKLAIEYEALGRMDCANVFLEMAEIKHRATETEWSRYRELQLLLAGMDCPHIGVHDEVIPEDTIEGIGDLGDATGSQFAPTSICTIQLFPFEPETVVDDCWTNEKRKNANLYLDLIEKGTMRGFWKIAGDINCALVSSNICPIIDLQDRAVGVGSGEWDGTCYSILEDSENWDFGKEDFTVEFWYKRAGSGVSSNNGPFDANGTCVVARQGYGFSMDSLGWSVELSYVKQDLATLFTYWRSKRREGRYIDSVQAMTCPRPRDGGTIQCKANFPIDPPDWPSYSIDHFWERAWESSLGKLGSPEMRFSFCVDNGKIESLNAPTSSAPAGTDGKILVPFTLSWGSPKANLWEHYAIVRSGQTFRTFKNGRVIDELVGDQSVVRYNVDMGDKLVGGTDSDTKFNIKSPANDPVLSIAGDTRFINKGWLLNGSLDELRISKGVARYIEEFEVSGQSPLGAVESLIPTTQKTASITYCPTNKMLYAFTKSSGQSYEINPRVNAITSTFTFSTSEIERVDSSYFCPINNTILVSSYDGLHRLYSFLPMVGKICQVFTTPNEGRMTYAPNTNKMYYACKNYVYEIGDIPYDDWDGVQQ